MPKKEREAKQAAFAMKKALDTEMTEEEAQRMEKSGMGVGGGLNKGEAQLFGTLAAPRHSRTSLNMEFITALIRREKTLKGGEEGGGGAQEG